MLKDKVEKLWEEIFPNNPSPKHDRGPEFEHDPRNEIIDDDNEPDFVKLYASLSGKNSQEDLVDMCDAKYGWSISKQLDGILNGEDLSEQNMNAMKHIITFLRSKGEIEVADELAAYVAENSSFNPNESIKKKVASLFESFDEEDKYQSQQFKIGDKVRCRGASDIPISTRFKGIAEVISVKEIRFISGNRIELEVKDANGEITKTRNDLVEPVDGFEAEVPPEIAKAAEEEDAWRMKNDPDYARDAIRRSKMSPEQIDMEDSDLPPGIGR